MNGFSIKMLAILLVLASSNAIATEVVPDEQVMTPEVIKAEAAMLTETHVPSEISPIGDLDAAPAETIAPIDTIPQLDSAALIAKAKAENAKRVRMRSAELSEVECLATAMYHEARGEGIRGMTAVAYVIHNRKTAGRFKDSYCGVVLQKSQFSFVDDRNPDNIKQWDVYAQAMDIAVKLIKSGFESSSSPVGGALFFNSLARSAKAVYSNGRRFVAKIGNHNFFK